MIELRIEFGAGPAREGGDKAVNFMLCYLDDGTELYSETVIPDGISEEEAEFYGYGELLHDILNQALELETL